MKLRHLLILVTVAVLFATTAVSCLVTDQIEFDDEVNHPLTILDYSPADTVQTLTGDVYIYVTLWDPDEADYSDFDARFIISRESGSVGDETYFPIQQLPVFPLSDTVYDEYYEENGTIAEYHHVVLSEQTITTGDSPPGSLISVTMEISDADYVGDEPADGAYTASVTWLFRVLD